MNKVLLAVGLLSAGMALGQNTTKSSSTTTSTSNYNTSNTNNENSRNATMGTNSSTDRPYSTTGSSYNSSGSTSGTGRSGMSTGSYSGSSTSGSYNNNGMGSSSGTYSNTSTSGYGSSSTPSTNGSYNSTTPSTNGSYNSNSMSTGTTTTPSTNSTYDTNSMGTGTSATTPSTTTDYNSTNNGSTVTTNSTYSTQSTTYPTRTKDYKNFAYGIYVGLNTTKFKGEALDANGSATALTGRLGYQAGFFVRGGGRLYGQIGAEYFASSSNYFTAGQGQSAASIKDQINIKYIQVPVYIGYKLTESDRGISAVRVQVGVEYANQIGSTANQFGNLNDFQVKSGTFNGLGQLGFDAGPIYLDLTYHYGFSNAIQQNAGFAGSQRRILSASVGFKF